MNKSKIKSIIKMNQPAISDNIPAFCITRCFPCFSAIVFKFCNLTPLQLLVQNKNFVPRIVFKVLYLHQSMYVRGTGHGDQKNATFYQNIQTIIFLKDYESGQMSVFCVKLKYCLARSFLQIFLLSGNAFQNALIKTWHKITKFSICKSISIKTFVVFASRHISIGYFICGARLSTKKFKIM